jgi:hypothetical protein
VSAIGEHVADFGRDFDAAEDEEVEFTSEVLDVLKLPESVVLRDADAIETARLRGTHEGVGSEGATGGVDTGVGVEVDQHADRR